MPAKILCGTAQDCLLFEFTRLSLKLFVNFVFLSQFLLVSLPLSRAYAMSMKCRRFVQFAKREVKQKHIISCALDWRWLISDQGFD